MLEWAVDECDRLMAFLRMQASANSDIGHGSGDPATGQKELHACVFDGLAAGQKELRHRL